MNTSTTAYMTLRIAVLIVIVSSLLELTHVSARQQVQTELTNHVYIPFVTQGNSAQIPPATPSPTPSTEPFPSPTPFPTPSPIPTEPPVDVAAYKAEVIRLINDYRVAHNCPAAIHNQMLENGAQAWDQHMVDTLEYQHSPMGWYKEFGYSDAIGRQGPGEVIQIGGATPQQAVQAWIDHPPHERIVRDCSLQGGTYEIGVGYIEPGYWVAAIGWWDR